MLYAGIDIRKSVFQVVVLDPDSGELSESRFEPSRERLSEWAAEWRGKLNESCRGRAHGLVAQRKTAHAISAAPASGATTRKIRSVQMAIRSVDDARLAA